MSDDARKRITSVILKTMRASSTGNRKPEGMKYTKNTDSPPCKGLPCPTSFAGHGALKTTEENAEVPSLDKEGWLRPLRKCREASFAGADGVVGSSHRLSEVERTTLPCFALSGSHSLRSCPAAPPKERDHLLDGAATPPCPRRGLRLSRRLSQTPASSGRLVGNDQPGTGGVAAPSRKCCEAT